MMALSESLTDLTTPLRPPRVLSWFDSLSAGRCTLPQLSRWVLEVCRDDPSAAAGVLLLLDEYRDAGQLKQFDLQPLQRELQRRSRQAHDPADETGDHQVIADPRPARPRKRKGIRDRDPTQSLEMPAPVSATPNSEAEVDGASAPGPTSIAPVGPTTVLRDRYVLHDEIGRGGVGTVYLAFDRNRAGLPHDEQYVALKVVRDEHARRPETLHALRREFHVAQSLSHPGIVNVYDFDHDGDTYFVTMELLDGEPLGELMRDALPHPLARETAYRILRELGDAIAYAHERDVLHMDLKPGNVMILRHGGSVRVLDFGVAQTFMAEPWISEVPTPPAATPAYASCERLVGDLPDVRDDIFSFACLAYELLSGSHPFDRGSALEARNKGLKARRIRGLSHRQWRVLKRALAFPREDRPGSMQELLEGLALPLGTPPRSVRQRWRPRRNASAPWPVAALGLTALCIVAALAWQRLPNDIRVSAATGAAAIATTLTQAGETARTWISSRTARYRGDAEQAAASAALPAPIAAPPVERAAPVVAPPAPEVAAVDTPAVEAGATPASTEPGPDVSAPAVVESIDATRPTAASPSGDGPGALEFAADTVTVSESDSMARVSVRRRGGAAGEVSFAWRTIDDSAIAGEDYAPAAVRETMAAGQTSVTLLIPIVADSVAEHTELLDLVIDEPSGADLGSLTRLAVIIIDDD